MKVTEHEARHLTELYKESPALAELNRLILELGGRMIGLRDGTPAPHFTGEPFRRRSKV